jgi:serine/threonine protein kinase
MLTGRNPVWTGRSSATTTVKTTEILQRIGNIPKPRHINAKIPPAVEQVVLKAIATDREQRYTSVETLVQELQAAAQKKSAWGTLPIYLKAGLIALLVLALVGLSSLWMQHSAQSSVDSGVSLSPTATVVKPDVVVLGPATSTPPPTSTEIEEIISTPQPATATLIKPKTGPTSTLAPQRPTSTPVRQAPASSNVAPRSSNGTITLLSPESEHHPPGNELEFRWHWTEATPCAPLPPNQGFEVRLYRANATPAGAMDAKNQAAIMCNPATGERSVTVGNIYLTGGVKGATEGVFHWDVAVVQLDEYKPLTTSSPRVIKIP